MRPAINIFLIIVAVQFVGHAQTDSLKRHPLINLYSGSLNVGFYEFANYSLNREELQALNPGNQLLKKDISAYQYTGNNREYTAVCYSSGLGLIFYNKKKKAYSNKQELHVGISYQKHEPFVYDYGIDERVRFDTLKSNTSPNVYYIDTTKTSRYHYSNYRDEILLSVMHTFHTKQNRIFSAYTGYSISYGQVISNVTKAEYTYAEGFEDQQYTTYDYTPRNNADISISETTSANKGTIFQLSVPVGGLLRFSNIKKNFMKKVALNMEARGGARLTQIPGAKTSTRFFFQMNFGIKYYWHRENIK